MPPTKATWNNPWGTFSSSITNYGFLTGTVQTTANATGQNGTVTAYTLSDSTMGTATIKSSSTNTVTKGSGSTQATFTVTYTPPPGGGGTAGDYAFTGTFSNGSSSTGFSGTCSAANSPSEVWTATPMPNPNGPWGTYTSVLGTTYGFLDGTLTLAPGSGGTVSSYILTNSTTGTLNVQVGSSVQPGHNATASFALSYTPNGGTATIYYFQGTFNWGGTAFVGQCSTTPLPAITSGPPRPGDGDPDDWTATAN